MVFWGYFLKAPVITGPIKLTHSSQVKNYIRDYSVYEQFTFITV